MGRFYPFAEKQSLYSTAQSDKAIFYKEDIGIKIPMKDDLSLNKETKTILSSKLLLYLK